MSDFDPRREECQEISTIPYEYETKGGCQIKGYISLRSNDYLAATIDGDYILTCINTYTDLMRRLETLYQQGQIRRSVF